MRRFGSVSGLTRAEFFDYFDGVAQGVALVLQDAERLGTSLPLDMLREITDGFQPPQFFARLSAQQPLLGSLQLHLCV